MYILPCVVTADNRIWVFQYKMLNNILFLNKMLFKFETVSQSLCSFCNSGERSLIPVFHNCTHIQNLWNQFQIYISKNELV